MWDVNPTQSLSRDQIGNDMVQIALLLSGVLFLAGGGVFFHNKWDKQGYTRRDLECRVEVADIRSHAEEVERQSRAEREKGRAIADELSAKLKVLHERLLNSEKRTRDELVKRTSLERAALDARATRLLNEQTRHDIEERTDSSGPSGSRTHDAGPAVAAADPDRSAGGTSERAIALWASTAISMYRTCATRLTAMQQWAKGIAQ